MPARFMALAISLIMIAGIQSCEQYQITPPDDIGEVTFSGTIQPIFTNNCAGCHNGTGHPLNLTAGSSYASMQAYTPEEGGELINTESPEESVLYIMALNGAHGFFSLSAKQEAQILKWIEEGALDN